MSVSGLCEICEAREVVNGCDRCGRLVCSRHRDEETGYCTECAAELRRSGTPDDDPGHREPGPDGVDTYRF